MTDEELRVRAIQELEFYKKDDTFMLADITVDLAIKALEKMPVTTTTGEEGVIYYPQVEGVTPTVVDAGKRESFDEYGNYKFPSDFELTEPNTATSMPGGDAIDRRLVCAFIDGLISDDGEREKGLEYIRNMPSVNPQPCEDAISRAEAVRVASGYCHPANVAKELAKLPPVTPQPKIGHWISHHHGCEYECSECHDKQRAKSNYCPNCGAKMIEPQESKVQDEAKNIR